MANSATINLLVRRVRQRADQINSATYDDATELKLWIRGSLSQLHEVLCDRWNDFYVVQRPLSLNANASAYGLPGDFRALHDVFVLGGGGTQRVRLQQFNAEDMENTSVFASVGVPVAYRLMRDVLYVLPTPQYDAINALELWYTPQWRPPLLDYTPIDDVMPNGWEEWVILDVLKKMAVKTRLLVSADIDKDKAACEARLLAASSVRTSDAPQMRDVIARRSSPWMTATPQGPAFWVGT